MDKNIFQNLFSALGEISSSLLSGSELQGILDLICRKTWETFDIIGCGISLLDKKKQLVWKAGYHQDNTIPKVLPLSPPATGFSQKVFETGIPFLCNDLIKYYRKHLPMRKLTELYGTSKLLAVPLQYERNSLGILAVARKKTDRDFMRNDSELMRSFANQAAIAIIHAQLIDKLKRKTQMLQKKQKQVIAQRRVLAKTNKDLLTILTISRYITKYPYLNKIVQEICTRTALALRVERCSIIIADDKFGGSVRGFHLWGGDAKSVLGRRLLWKQFPNIAKVLKRGGFYNIPNTRKDKKLTFSGKEYFRKNNIQSFATVSIYLGKKVLGIMIIGEMTHLRTYTSEEIKFLQTIANQTALAIEKSKFTEQASTQSKSLETLSHLLMETQESERKKIALNLQDEISRRLVALQLNLKSALDLFEKKPEESKIKILEAEALTKEIIQKTRNILRDLTPPLLDDFGLIPALHYYLEDFSRRTGIKIEFHSNNFPSRVNPQVQTTLFRIIQEGLTNVLKHSQTKKVEIDLGLKKSGVYLIIENKGAGLKMEKALTQSFPFPLLGVGILGMKERVELLNGNFKIHSPANRGTKIEIFLPLTYDGAKG